MRVSHFAKESGAPDLTPLIDCVFQLLIFFMVTTTFITTKGISVDLPTSSKMELAATKDINIIINKDGVIEVNGEKVTMEDLAQKIRQVSEEEKTKNAILQADREVLHKVVVKVMDIARGEGIESIAFASETKGRAPSMEVTGGG